jgi:enterochelin esterase family protein
MLVEQLVQDGAIEPVVTAFVYNPDATRNRDMSCYPPTHRFLADELLPLLRERFRAARSPARTILAGRSRSALAAACAAYTMPGEIGNVISQSGAFWLAP